MKSSELAACQLASGQFSIKCFESGHQISFLRPVAVHSVVAVATSAAAPSWSCK